MNNDLVQRQIDRERLLHEHTGAFTSTAGAVDRSERLIGPLLCAAVTNLLRSEGDGNAEEQLLDGSLTSFKTKLSEILVPHRGAPPHFVKVWAALKLNAEGEAASEDATLVFFMTLYELIHASLAGLAQEDLARFHEHGYGITSSRQAKRRKPSDSNDSLRDVVNTDVDGTALDAENPREGDEDAIEEEMTDSDKTYVSQQVLYQRIWESICIELTLREPEASPSDHYSAKSLHDTSLARSQRAAVALRLRQAAEETFGVEYADGLQFACVLVKLVSGCFDPPWFIMSQIGGGRGLVRVRGSPTLLSRIRSLSSETKLIERYAPLIAPPRAWGGENGISRSGYYVRPLPFYKVWTKNGRLREFLELAEQYPPLRVIEAANFLQGTSWRINHRVFTAVESIYGIAGVPFAGELSKAFGSLGSRLDPEARSAMSRAGVAKPLSSDLHENWRGWIERSFYYREGKKLKGTGARLATRIAAETVHDLRKHDRFWFAYQADTRGRLYPVAGILSPQGDDLSSALLEFADGKPLSQAGARALAIHGSQQVQRTTILGDLAISDRIQPTLDERIRWIENRTVEILQSASDPIRYPWWRDVSSSPFRFLAFCFAWHDFIRHGEGSVCSLPVQVDGTCNGFQHIAAITRDRVLAQATNVLPGQPRDIYSETATAVQERIDRPPKALPDSATQNGTARATLASATAVLGGRRWQIAAEILSVHRDLIDRDMAKKVVMVIPYGAGVETYAEEIAEFLTKRVIGGATRYADLHMPTVLETIERLVPEDYWRASDEELRSKDRQRQQPTGAATARGRMSRDLADAVEESPEARRIQLIRRWLTTDIALYIALSFQEVVRERHGVVDRFKKALSDAIQPLVNLDIPVCWEAPSGFAVIQKNFRFAAREIDSKFLGERLRFSLRTPLDSVSVKGQLKAILPNFIHSQDASHLVFSILRAKNAGITAMSAIHDSFGTHAADAPALSRCIREAFCELYPDGKNPAESFTAWIGLCIAAACGAKPEVDAIQALSAFQRGLLDQICDGANEARGARVAVAETVDPWEIHSVIDSEYFFA
jgi:hypothetical protein